MFYKLFKIGFLAFIFTSFSSCSKYQSLPLDEDAITNRLETPDVQKILIEAENIKSATLEPIKIDGKNNLTPELAAVIAVLTNPVLKAERDKKGVALGQVIQAGILPNPVFSASADFPYSSPTPGTVIDYMLSVTWNFISLFSYKDRVAAVRSYEQSVELDIAWQEWQIAEKAKQQVYRNILLKRELEVTKRQEDALIKNRNAMKQALQEGNKTLVDLSAVESTLEIVHLSVLSIAQTLEIERLALNETLGFPPDYHFEIDSHILIPHFTNIPILDDIFEGVEKRRFDLLALKMGYESQDSKLRAAIINQIQPINIGPSISRDNTDVKMAGFQFFMDLPIFNRNQGIIAIEEATRTQLYDEYMARVYTTRSQIATVLANLRYLQQQIEFTNRTVHTLEELNKTYYQALLSGNADVLTYYNSIFNLISRQIELLKLQQLYIEQYIALEILSGQFLQPQDKKIA